MSGKTGKPIRVKTIIARPVEITKGATISLGQMVRKAGEIKLPISFVRTLSPTGVTTQQSASRFSVSVTTWQTMSVGKTISGQQPIEWAGRTAEGSSLLQRMIRDSKGEGTQALFAGRNANPGRPTGQKSKTSGGILAAGGKDSGSPLSANETALISVVETGRTSYATELHNEWRNGRQITSGQAVDGLPAREPRWKEVPADDPSLATAGAFKKTEDGKHYVDIANLDFGHLPVKFQYENGEAAKGAMDIIERAIVEQAGAEVIVINLETASAEVHEQWLERNGSWAPAEQNKPYGELSEGEKQKDRDIVVGAVKHLNEAMKDSAVQFVIK